MTERDIVIGGQMVSQLGTAARIAATARLKLSESSGSWADVGAVTKRQTALMAEAMDGRMRTQRSVLDPLFPSRGTLRTPSQLGVDYREAVVGGIRWNTTQTQTSRKPTTKTLERAKRAEAASERALHVETEPEADRGLSAYSSEAAAIASIGACVGSSSAASSTMTSRRS